MNVRACLVVLALAAASPAGPEQFRDPRGRWIVAVPAGLRRAAPDDPWSSEVFTNSGSKVAEFRQSDGAAVVEAFWTQALPGAAAAEWGQAASDPASLRGRAVQALTPTFVARARLGRPTLDEKPPRWSFDVRAKADGGEALAGRRTTFFGESGFAVLQCSGPDADVERLMPRFNEMLDSFAFDEGRELRPGAVHIGLLPLLGLILGPPALGAWIWYRAHARRTADHAREMQRG